MGIALGTGTDVALAAADVDLLGGSISSVADALDLARRTYRVIAQNLFWAFAYNVVMIPLAVFGRPQPHLGGGGDGALERDRGRSTRCGCAGSAAPAAGGTRPVARRVRTLPCEDAR